MINDDFLAACLCISYVIGCRSAGFALHFPLVYTADWTVSPKAAPVCPEPCSYPVEVTLTLVKIHEGLEGIQMQSQGIHTGMEGVMVGGEEMLTSVPMRGLVAQSR